MQRPIVGFSIEDRAVHNMKEKRLQRSKVNNPTFKAKLNQKNSKRTEKSLTKGKLNVKLTNIKEESKAKVKQSVLAKKRASGNLKKNGKNVANPRKNVKEAAIEPVEGEFVGEASKPGTNLRMRSIKKIREQAKEHLQSVKKEKKRLKKQKSKKFFRRNRAN